MKKVTLRKTINFVNIFIDLIKIFNNKLLLFIRFIIWDMSRFV